MARARLAVIIAMLSSCSNEPANTPITLAVEAPSLGTSAGFAVLAATMVTSTGPTVITGDLGLSPGTSITGFPPGIVNGTIHQTDAAATQARADAQAAYATLASEACDTVFGVPTDLGGLTLLPGVYCFESSAGLTGQLTLDAQGDPDAVWLFRTGSTLITAAANSSVLVIDGGQDCNVFWQVGSSATIGTFATFVGTIIALTSITINTSATISGRAFALEGAVTLDSNQITVPACAITPSAPTLEKTFDPATIAAGDSSLLTITLGNADSTTATLTAPLTDNLPSGVSIAGTPTTTCGGTASANTTSVTLTGGAIPATGSCTVSVLVTAANGGSYLNSLAAGALQTSHGSNAASADATLTVSQIPPTLAKSFSPNSIVVGGTSLLTITIGNPDGSVASLGAPLVDTLPIGVVIAGPPATTCGGAVTADTGSVTLTDGTIPANGSCTVTVLVTAASEGSYVNTLAFGAVPTSNNTNRDPAITWFTATAVAGSYFNLVSAGAPHSNHAGLAIATLTVLSTTTAPTVEKDFDPPTIYVGEVSTLTITLRNPSASSCNLTGPLSDYLPAGMVIAGTATTTCGGTCTAYTGGSEVTLTGGSIPAHGSCTVTVGVTADSEGSYCNTIPICALETDHGNNHGPAEATLTVLTSLPTYD